VIVYRGRDELEFSGAEIAPYLGVNPASINRASAEMDQLPKKYSDDERQDGKWEK
jgi:hypothetical protein